MPLVASEDRPLPYCLALTLTSSQVPIPEQERWGGYAAFSDKICGDQVQIFGDFYYDDVKQHDELAPIATVPFVTPGFPTTAIPPHAPFPLDANGVPITPPNTPTAGGRRGASAGHDRMPSIPLILSSRSSPVAPGPVSSISAIV